MAGQVSQQIVVVGYTTVPEGRVTAVAAEVIRPTASIPVVSAKGVQVIVVAS